jgi:predicted TIM-barrel fold metal-dependent hydrolase
MMVQAMGTLAAGAGLKALSSGAAYAQTTEAVPYSTGTAKPRLSAPPNSCDCHMHHYGTRYPAIPGALRPHPDATVADYRLLQKRIGTTRVVVVTPSLYGTDNSASLDAMAAFGPSARGVAVVTTSVEDAELKRLAGLGIRGIRFNLSTPGTTTIEMVEPLSKRVHELGWHLQFHMRPEQIVESEALLARLPSPIVFDHMGRIPRSVGIEHPAYKVMRGLLDKGRTWVKLSGAYMDIKAGDTKAGPPAYADSVTLAQAFLKTAPERMVWGSDWPHPTEKDKPDDAALFDLLAAIAPEEPLRARILVANPAQLYDFPKAV